MSVPDRLDAAKWRGTEKEWFYCNYGSRMGTWCHISKIERPIIGDFDKVKERYDKINKIYGQRIELVEVSDEFEQYLTVCILKSSS